ncbi:hypothetical protein Dimus_024636 [Dionaea muscipula]
MGAGLTTFDADVRRVHESRETRLQLCEQGRGCRGHHAGLPRLVWVPHGCASPSTPSGIWVMPAAAAAHGGGWPIGSSMEVANKELQRRRDDDDETPEEEVEEEEKDQTDFDWEAVVDEAAVEGESGSDEQFYDAQVDVEEPVTETPAAPEVVAQASVQQKETAASGVDPSCPTGRIPEAVMNKFQAEFERTRANRFQADL